MQVEGGGNNRRTSDDRSCTLVGISATEDEYIEFHGISEGEKCANDI